MYKYLFIFFMLVFSVSAVQAQDKNENLKASLDAKRFSFEVRTVLPTSGSARQVGGSGYQLKLQGDSLRSYLPYYGRAYSASMGSDAGYTFTSTKFDYTITDRKKGGWQVSIKPKDVPDVRELLLTVSENGAAVLQAMSNNRQPISYNGDVTAQQ
jgi:hypothetical protein